MTPPRALVLCIALLGSFSSGQKAPAESGTDLVVAGILADGAVRGRRLMTGCGPPTVALSEDGNCGSNDWEGVLVLRDPDGDLHTYGTGDDSNDNPTSPGPTQCGHIPLLPAPPALCGEWTVTYDLSGENDIAFTIDLGASSMMVSVDRRSGNEADGRGFPPSGEFTFILGDGPRVTVEDFADGSTGGSNFQCPSFARWFGTLTLTDPNGDKHYFGRGLDLDRAMPGKSWLLIPRSHVKTCADLEIQGQSLPSVCGTWEYEWRFTDSSDVQECVPGFQGWSWNPCKGGPQDRGDPDLGFVIKVDGFEEVSVGRKQDGSGGDEHALTGSGSFSAPCEPSSQPSGQPTEQPSGQPSSMPSDQPSPAPSKAPTPCHACGSNDECYKCEFCNFEAEGGSGRQLRFGYSKTGCCHTIPGCLEK